MRKKCGTKEKSRSSGHSVSPTRFPFPLRSLSYEPALEHNSLLALPEHVSMCNTLSTSLWPTFSYFLHAGVELQEHNGYQVSKGLQLTSAWSGESLNLADGQTRAQSLCTPRHLLRTSKKGPRFLESSRGPKQPHPFCSH